MWQNVKFKTITLPEEYIGECICGLCVSKGPLSQGSPTPWPWTGTSLWPVRNQAAQQEVSGRRVSEASPAAPHRLHYCLSHHIHPPTPGLWKNCLPRNQSLVPKRLRTTALSHTHKVVTIRGKHWYTVLDQN